MKKKTTVLRYCINIEREKCIVTHAKEITHLYHTRSLHSSSLSQLEPNFLGVSLIPLAKSIH